MPNAFGVLIAASVATSLSLTGCVFSKDGLIEDQYISPYKQIKIKKRNAEGVIETTTWTMNTSRRNTYISNNNGYVGKYIGIVDKNSFDINGKKSGKGRTEYVGAFCDNKDNECMYFDLEIDEGLKLARARLYDTTKLIEFLAPESCPGNKQSEPECKAEEINAINGVRFSRVVKKTFRGVFPITETFSGLINLVKIAEGRDLYWADETYVVEYIK